MMFVLSEKLVESCLRKLFEVLVLLDNNYNRKLFGQVYEVSLSVREFVYDTVLISSFIVRLHICTTFIELNSPLK